MTDLLFLTAPPVGCFGRGLLTVRRQHQSPDGSCDKVQVKHGVALAEDRKERKKVREKKERGETTTLYCVSGFKKINKYVTHKHYADRFALNNARQK